MNVFFDNCTSPVMARTLAGYLGEHHNVRHIRDLGLARASDVEWIEHLRSSGEQWLVITGDGRIRRNPAEREAFRKAKLCGVVLDPAYQKTPMGRCCGMLVAKWDELVVFTDRAAPPFLVGFSINLQPKFKILPF